LKKLNRSSSTAVGRENRLHLYAVECVAAVEVSLLAHKRCKVSDITEMHLIAGAVQTATTIVVYVRLSSCIDCVTCN